MKRKLKFFGSLLLAVFAATGFYLMGLHDNQTVSGLELVKPAEAAGGKVTNPDGTAPDRYMYYPGTEALGKDEIRLIALGTGMPLARRSQAATCWLVEVGNGDKFLFDIGTGANANLSSLMIPFDFLRKGVSDPSAHGPLGRSSRPLGRRMDSRTHRCHWKSGDRPVPGRTWGPSTRLSIFCKAYNWDNMTRLANLNSKPGKIIVHEFDFKGENQVVYQENGVTIRSWPAIHAGDGSVSFSLVLAGMKIIIGGDSMPNTWYRKYAVDADVAIHECFMTPELLVKLYNQAPKTALGVGTYVHTSPQAFGKIMSTVKPRHAIAYHFFNEADTRLPSSMN